MSIIRVARRSRYAVVDQRTVEDAELSFRARGVLLWLLAKPDDWRCDSETIASAGREGRDAVRRALGELEAAGYLVREVRRGARGRVSTVVTVHERPVDKSTGDGFPVVGAPVVGFPGPLPSTTTEVLTSTDGSGTREAEAVGFEVNDRQPPWTSAGVSREAWLEAQREDA